MKIQNSVKYLLMAFLLAQTALASNSAHAEQIVPALESPAPAAAAPAAFPTASPIITDPLIVEGLTIDKTAKNAVIARDEAIVEARRAAFQNLAQRNLTPEEFAALKIPSDSELARLVQDLEIKKEQLSTTRYVASFTVRFRDGVNNYVDVKPLPAVPATITEAVGGPDNIEGDTIERVNPDAAISKVAVAPAKSVLILPYMQNFEGKTVLWEDPNAWRAVWQNSMPKLPGGTAQYIVPLGDISDVSAGSSEAVWSGNYRVIEALRSNYRADEVILPVASKNGPIMSVDIYSYKDGSFTRRGTITPATAMGASDTDMLHQAAGDVLRYLERPVFVTKHEDVVSSISRELVTDGAAEHMRDVPLPPSATTRPPLQNGTMVDAAMSFDSFVTWMETQKRLSTMVPPVSVDIKAISKNGARFTMRFDGDINTLQRVLADRGIRMAPSAVQVDPAVMGGAAGAPAYDLVLAN